MPPCTPWMFTSAPPTICSVRDICSPSLPKSEAVQNSRWGRPSRYSTTEASSIPHWPSASRTSSLPRGCFRNSSTVPAVPSHSPSSTSRSPATQGWKHSGRRAFARPCAASRVSSCATFLSRAAHGGHSTPPAQDVHAATCSPEIPWGSHSTTQSGRPVPSASVQLPARPAARRSAWAIAPSPATSIFTIYSTPSKCLFYRYTLSPDRLESYTAWMIFCTVYISSGRTTGWPPVRSESIHWEISSWGP